MPPRKRNAGTALGPVSKRARGTAIKADPDGPARGVSFANEEDEQQQIRSRFVQLFENNPGGVSNPSLKQIFSGPGEYMKLVPVINELTQCSRLIMSKIGDELFYNLVDEEVASKFAGLDVSARMVYQVIEKSGNLGVWTKDVRYQTNIQQQALNKIFKALEGRRLIKPVKSVSAKKVYMLYNLTPAKELTGGPWYTELEFDHEFINEMRKFLLQCVRRLNSGAGVTLVEIKDKMMEANVSKVQLNVEEVQQLMQTLAYDHLIEEAVQVDSASGDTLYVAARRVTSMCDFKWW
eukprot:CAMPEP_0119011976 /NCGR_PEP_ID=MMETSP1176-20130426/6001_1 /TAXON_ID=265551 /ORGANISM="Synedropsis recta cf, Strain CCMP1620" /LENGTH=292 /DNA_ID=CAMNT_0006964863 /DNA_START=88 /DNA_END=963 /DNA_ORIENTATION=-